MKNFATLSLAILVFTSCGPLQHSDQNSAQVVTCFHDENTNDNFAFTALGYDHGVRDIFVYFDPGMGPILNTVWGSDWKRQAVLALHRFTQHIDANITLVPDRRLATMTFEPAFREDMLPAAGFIANARNIYFNTAHPHHVTLAENILLHEFGHGLGLNHSADATAVMYFNSTATQPSQDDIKGVRKTWGTRIPDHYEGKPGNDSFERASTVTLSKHGPAHINADIHSLADEDYFYIDLNDSNAVKVEIKMNDRYYNPRNIGLEIFDHTQMSIYQKSANSHAKFVTITDAMRKAGGFYLRTYAGVAAMNGYGSYTIIIE